MLITIYQKVPGGLQKVNEYYWWNVPLIYEISDQDATKADLKYKIPCPGCGKIYSRVIIKTMHQCPGTLTDHPVAPRYLRSNYKPMINDHTLTSSTTHKQVFGDTDLASTRISKQ